MKKITMLLCAVVLAVSAVSAQCLPERSGKSLPEFSFTEMGLKPFKATKAGAASRAVATTMDELVGEYICQCYDYTQEETPQTTFIIDVQKGKNANEILIYGMAEMPLPIVAKVDFEAGAITIDNQQLEGKYVSPGDGAEYDIFFQHAAWVEDERGNSISAETDLPLEVLILDGGLLFGYTNDIISLKAYQGGEFIDFWCAVSYMPAMKAYVDPDTYVKLEGKAKFYDGWLLPGFGVDPEEYPMDVDIERSMQNPNQFRLVNPYPQGYLDINEGISDPGYIVFDITRPDIVVVRPGYKSGFYEKSVWGKGNFYFYNLEGFLIDDFEALGQPKTLDEIKQLMIGSDYELSTFADGVVTIKNCLFGYDQNPMAGGLWTVGGQPVEMTAKVILPDGALVGIEAAELNPNAPVEYFNLQGIKVQNPGRGLYIRRQGQNVEKVYIK